MAINPILDVILSCVADPKHEKSTLASGLGSLVLFLWQLSMALWRYYSSQTKDVTGRAEAFSITDWSVGPGTTRASSFYFAPQDRNFSTFVYEIEATPHAGFYVWKVVLPLMIFIFMSWTVFWLKPSYLGTQIALSATVMVILVVFQLNLVTVLPRVSYLTRVDRFVLGSLFLVFMALLEAVTSGTLSAQEKQALAERLDRWARGVFPIIFVGLVVGAFWL